MRRRIWCETVPAAEIAAPEVIALLRRFALTPIVAVWPHTLAAARPALGRLGGAGIRAAVWPMLADAEGRWLGEENAGRFSAFVEQIADTLQPAEIVLDLEPPIEALRATVAAIPTIGRANDRPRIEPYACASPNARTSPRAVASQ